MKRRAFYGIACAREVQTIHRGTRKGQTVITSKRPLRHLARFVLIGLYTGTRAGAIATASPMRLAGRSFVDLEQGVYYRLALGKRATAKRQPAVPLPARLLAHLRRWQRVGIAREYFVEWNGKAVRSGKTAFGSAVAAIELEGRVTPHTLRHTAATWLMQAGVPLWQAAGFLGMSEKLLEQTYGHHHPDHLREAAQKIGYGNRRPAGAGKPETLVVSLAEERAKRTPTGQVIENAGGPGRTRTCNQTVMSGRL
jgi:integrase